MVDIYNGGWVFLSRRYVIRSCDIWFLGLCQVGGYFLCDAGNRISYNLYRIIMIETN